MWLCANGTRVPDRYHRQRDSCAGVCSSLYAPGKDRRNQDAHKASPYSVRAVRAMLATAPMDYASAQPSCPAMRKINIGVSVAPPNVVHTSPYVAKALGYFEKRCIDANIVQFEGGQSQTSAVGGGAGLGDRQRPRRLDSAAASRCSRSGRCAAHAAGSMCAGRDSSRRPTSRASGCRRPAAASVAFNWRMGRAVLKSANLDVGDAQFIPSPTAGRLPGLIAGQIDGVALHPEDVFLAQQQKSALRPLVQLVELMPLYMFNAYGASTDWIAKDRARCCATPVARYDRGQPHHLPRQG